jgi:hypothetical protein
MEFSRSNFVFLFLFFSDGCSEKDLSFPPNITKTWASSLLSGTPSEAIRFGGGFKEKRRSPAGALETFRIKAFGVPFERSWKIFLQG